MSDAELSARLAEVWAAEQALAAQRLALIAEIDGRGQPRREGATCTTAWLRDILRIHPHTAGGMLRLARDLAAPAMGATARALAQAQVNTDQAAAITRVIGDLPRGLDQQTIVSAERVLLGYAPQFTARDLAVLGARVLDHVAPEIAEQHQRQQLERQETQARRERGLTLIADGLGRVRLRGVLDTESAATVSTAIDALCAPAAENSTAENSTAQDDQSRRTAAQKRADALVEVCRLALVGGQLPDHGGEPPPLIVTMPFPSAPASGDSDASTPNGWLDTGQALSPATMRRLACDAKVIPVVLGGEGQVLDVGRARRLFTGPIRKALIARDLGCAFPACDRPPRWTEAHHLRSWLVGGVTSVDNGVLLCGWHPRLIHESKWQVRLGPDHLPEFIPPPYIDPEQLPRRNRYHRRT